MRDLFTFRSRYEPRLAFWSQKPADEHYMPSAGFWESVESAGECFLYIEDRKRDDMLVQELDKVILSLQELANKMKNVPQDENDAKYLRHMQLLIGAYILYALQLKLRAVDSNESTDKMQKLLINICEKKTYPREIQIADLLPETNNVEDIDRIIQEIRSSYVTYDTDSSISILASTRDTSVASSVLGSPTRPSPARSSPARPSPAKHSTEKHSTEKDSAAEFSYYVGDPEMRLPDPVSQDAQPSSSSETPIKYANRTILNAFFDRDRMPVFLIGALALRRHYRRRTDQKLWI